jgi:hypothetical protein
MYCFDLSDILSWFISLIVIYDKLVGSCLEMSFPFPFDGYRLPFFVCEVR